MRSLEFVVMDIVIAHPMPLFTHTNTECWIENNRFKQNLTCQTLETFICIYSKLWNRNKSAWNRTCNNKVANDAFKSRGW